MTQAIYDVIRYYVAASTYRITPKVSQNETLIAISFMEARGECVVVYS